MKIIRQIGVLKREFVLTEEELWEAYEEQKNKLYLEDAENSLEDFLSESEIQLLSVQPELVDEFVKRVASRKKTYEESGDNGFLMAIENAYLDTKKEFFTKEAGKIRVCNRCGNELLKETDPEIGYPYYCVYCEENMYTIETTLKDCRERESS